MARETSIIYASRISTNPGLEPTRPGGNIRINNGLITSIDDAEQTSTGQVLAIPALGNAHDHGRGIKYLSFGLRDDALEAWVPGFYSRPDVDPYLDAVAIMARFAEAGIGSAVHCHTMPRTSEELERQIAAVSRAARDVGIRIGLVVPMRDRNRFCYGDDERILSLFSEKDRHEVMARYGYTPLPPKEQVARVEYLAAKYENELVHIQYGPTGVQWASNELLELVSEASERTGRRVHMHLLETKYQREWLDQTYKDGVVQLLDKIGLLSPRLTVAHGVWLSSAELDLLAERGTIISLNTSSNLRLGSGVAPAREMFARKVKFALGLDGLCLDDDDDALREMRLAGVLHRGPGFADNLPMGALFSASMAIAPQAVTGATNHGELRPGMAADIVTLDYASISASTINGLLDDAELVFARGTAKHVRSLIVAGRQVVMDGKVQGVDLPSVEAELARQMQMQNAAIADQAKIISTYQENIRRYYLSRMHLCGCEFHEERFSCT